MRVLLERVYAGAARSELDPAAAKESWLPFCRADVEELDVLLERVYAGAARS
jgi:hypothetical protein